MPLDSAEGFSAALKAIGFGEKVIALAQQLPPVTPDRPRKLADFGPILGLVQSDLLPLIDQVVEDVKD